MKTFAQQTFEDQFQLDLNVRLAKYRFKCGMPKIDTSLAAEKTHRWTLRGVSWIKAVALRGKEKN